MIKEHVPSNPNRSINTMMNVGVALGVPLGMLVPGIRETLLYATVVNGALGGAIGAGTAYVAEKIGRMKNVDVTVGNQTVTNVPLIEAADVMGEIQRKLDLQVQESATV